MSSRKGSAGIAEALRCVFFPGTSFHTARQPARVTTRSIRTDPATIKPMRPPPSLAADPKAWGPQNNTKVTKDESIDSVKIRMVDKRGDVGQIRYRDLVLNSFDRSEFFLVQIDKGESDVPLCKIVSKATIFEREKQQARSGKTQKEGKEVEIPWKAADGDIDHKLKIARDFLAEGKKVDIVLIARRPREVVKDLDKAQAVVDRVMGRILKLENVKETTDKASVLGKSFTIHLEGPPKNKVKKTEKGKTGKEIEMLWNITDMELEKKKFRIAELLGSNIPVNLVVTSKRKQFEISAEEGQQVLDKIWTSISQIRGIQEIQPREGELGKTVTLFLTRNPDTAAEEPPKEYKSAMRL